MAVLRAVILLLVLTALARAASYTAASVQLSPLGTYSDPPAESDAR